MMERDLSLRIKAALADHPAVVAAEVVNDGGSERNANWLIYIRLTDARLTGPARELKFSLFYFADAGAGGSDEKYKLYLQGARFADENEFEAVWTPERHFHEKGGLYPNPAVLSAALATTTKNIKLRSGSVVLPLHHPLRAAEDWSLVDNLSNGRVGVSFTSGWVPNDFAIAPTPESFGSKRQIMFRYIRDVQRLWSGEAIQTKDGVGNDVFLRVFPRPIQPSLPIWLTCSGDPAMFERAGELGFNVLTALLTHTLDEAAAKIALYRESLARHGRDPRSGCVTLMLHTFVDEDEDRVRETVRQPMIEYLKAHIDLTGMMAKGLNLKVDTIDAGDPRWLDSAAAFGFERYYKTGSMLGTPAKCMKTIERLKEIGVDEVACLIDFGVEVDTVLDGLNRLNDLRVSANSEALEAANSLRVFLRERLPDLEGAISIRFVEQAPDPSTAGRPGFKPEAAAALASNFNSQVVELAAPFVAPARTPRLDSLEERVRLQRASAERQSQLRRKKSS